MMNDQDQEVMYWAFQHFYHMDKANACIHEGEVRFSPITFSLALRLQWVMHVSGHPMLDEVISHHGRYTVDTGR
jgi:hypothetical protein